jgi:hypothetical protein
MTRITSIVRSLVLCAVAAFALAMPVAKADPPKATLLLINATGHEVSIAFSSASNPTWMKAVLAPGTERIFVEIVGPLKLAGTVRSNPPAALVPRDVILSKTSFTRLRIELVDGRYSFVNP